MGDTESKHDKFKRLAESRTEKVLNMIDLIGNLANLSNYEYSEKEIKEIFGTIERVLKENEAKFRKAENKKGRKFTL